MADRNLREGDYREHEAEMKKVQDHLIILIECVPHMKRLKIIDLPTSVSQDHGSDSNSGSSGI